MAACSGGHNRETQVDYVEPIEYPQEKEPLDAGDYYYINNQKNISLAEIIINGKDLVLHVGDETLVGDLKRDDKRKYYDNNDNFRYAVKYKDRESFKLRDSNEELLWKVKIKEDKISIANNEEMNNAFDIRIYDGNRIKLKKSDSEINSMRFDPNSDFLEVEDYSLRGFKNTMAPAVLMIPDMKPLEKYIICTELVNIGK
ncbi:hypothetical protein [Fulvivirga ligni]|uniref:hypothetical protein n=1 Tax=Fulvivirga ligni TaxID=2904246 RepID=UPI001F3638D9|nr:hypothetical protein [Fulvivirga ligni]UII19456.1 hypothetical protein LVD16_16575 [Fulvivirga ligni]